MPDRSKIQDLMAPIDPEEAVARVGEKLVEMAEDDERMRSSLRAIQERFARPFVSEHILELRRQRLGRRRASDALGGFEGMTTLMATLYSRVTQHMQTRGIPSAVEIANAVENAENKLDELGADFFGDLMLEAESAALRRPAFARRLADGVKSIQSMEPELNKLAERSELLFLGRRSSPLKCYIGDKEVPCWKAFLLAICIIIIIIIVYG